MLTYYSDSDGISLADISSILTVLNNFSRLPPSAKGHLRGFEGYTKVR